MSKSETTEILWMKLAGVCGLVLIALLFIQLIFTIIPLATASSTFKMPSVVSTIISIISLITTVLFLYGFVRMGKHTSKLLRFSAITLLVLLAVTILAFFTMHTYVQSVIANATPNAIPLNTSNSSNSPLAAILIFIFIAFVITITILFEVGLIISGKQVRFAKLSGILGIIWIALWLIFIGYIFLNPLAILALLMFLVLGAKITMISIFIVVFLVSATILLLDSLALFDASKKFE